MLVQIRDRDYLFSQKDVSPNVTPQMYDFVGDQFDIDDTEIYDYKTYYYAGFSWLGKWLFDPTKDAQKPFTLEDTNYNKYIECLKGLKMPENLQHIRLVSNHFRVERTTPITDPISGEIKYSLILERIPQGSRLPEPSMYIKFSGATEYNISKYMAYATMGKPVSAYDTRQYEEDVRVVIDQLGVGTLNYLSMIKNDNLSLSKHGVDKMGQPLHYQCNSNYIDTMYIPMFLGTAMTHYSTYIQSQPFTRFNDNVDKSLIYYGSHNGTFHSIKQEDYDKYFYNAELKKCPIFGIKTFGKDPISIYFRVSYASSGPVLLAKHYNHDLVWDTYYERLKNSDHIWSKLERGYIWRGNVYDKEGFDRVMSRYEKYKQYGLTVNSDNYNYRGQKYYYGDDIINEYDYEPYIEFYGDGTDLHFGIELEIDGGGESHDNAGMILAPMWNSMYAMHDGSLNEGFELATHPMTLDYFEEHKQNFRDMFGIARLLDYRSHNTTTCGLHIHFDKDFFGRDYRTQNTKASYLALIMERNWEKFVKFSRRNYNRLDNWAKKMDLINDIYADDDDDDAMNKFNGKYGNGDKYIALNTAHSNTYELRIFRGTLKVETFYATLQFVDNLVRVAKECPSLAKAQQITFADIIDYKQHKELIEYVNTRGILTREYKEYEEE